MNHPAHELENKEQQYDYVFSHQSKKTIKSSKNVNSAASNSQNIQTSSQVQSQETISLPSGEQNKKTIVQYIFLDQDQFKLGQGSYGAVYKCYTKQNSKIYRFALKIIKVPEIHGSIMSGQDIIDTTRQEIKTLMLFKDNQNIIKIQDLIRDDRIIYLILEYCNDKDIISYFKKLRGLTSQNQKKQKSKIDSIEKINQFLAQLLNGFKDLHKNKITHRDIKPGNLLVNNGVLKIADFGLSKPLYEKSQLMSQFVGTLCTAAPQIKFKQDYTAKCDIYSLGVVYYWMIYYKYPFKDNLSKQQYLETKVEYSDLSFDNFIVTEQVKKLIISMLSYEEKQRPDWNDLFSHPFFSKYLITFSEPKSRISFDRGMTMIQSQDFNQQIPEEFYKYVNEKDLKFDRFSFDQYQDFIFVMRAINWFNLKISFFKELIRELSNYSSKEQSETQIQQQTLCDIIRLGVQKYTTFLTKKLSMQITFKDVPEILDRNALKSLQNQQQFNTYSKDVLHQMKSFQESQQKPKLSKDQINRLIKKCEQYKIEEEFQSILQDSKECFDAQKTSIQISKAIMQFIFLVKPEIKNFHFKKQQLKTSFEQSRFKFLVILVHHLNMFVMHKQIFPKVNANIVGNSNQDMHIPMDFMKKQKFQEPERFHALANQIQFLLDRFQE